MRGAITALPRLHSLCLSKHRENFTFTFTFLMSAWLQYELLRVMKHTRPLNVGSRNFVW